VTRRLLIVALIATALAGCGDEPRAAAPASGSTLRATLVDRDGDGFLERGPAAAFIDRRELGGGGAPGRTIARFGQLTDTHVRDEESPARVPFLDRVGPPFTSTFRPQEAESAQVLDAAVRALDRQCPQAVAITGDCIVVDTAEGHYSFDSVYPALGSDTHTQLGEMVGAELAEDGCFLCDDHQRTSVSNLYAAGDVVHGLDQISHAMGEGGVAATTIRNDLYAQSPRWREPVEDLEQAESAI